MSKQFNLDTFQIRIQDPMNVEFGSPYYQEIYEAFFQLVTEPDYTPQINVDDVHTGILGFDPVLRADAHNIQVDQPSARATNRDRLATQLCIRKFLNYFPEFSGLLFNTTSSAQIAISNAEFIIGAPCDAANFIECKRIIDRLNLQAWDRDLDTSERQSGVSVLGTISETLLERALEALVDDVNFFKVNHGQVQSYGDFVLMCLPNNLWISVKSNFARERLLASGYSNDILGVGFFQDHTEFTSTVRIRNLQRAGFLAMYCPDAPVTPEQVANQTSTYQLVCDEYARMQRTLPNNINGQPFIRALSSLGDDLQDLIDEVDVRRRHTVGF